MPCMRSTTSQTWEAVMPSPVVILRRSSASRWLFLLVRAVGPRHRQSLEDLSQVDSWDTIAESGKT